jgi:DNA-binding transcriptional regulator YiaG
MTTVIPTFIKGAAMSAIKSTESLDVREIRQKLGYNQSVFWGKVGVTQSGGSRYESGRKIPRSVSELLRLVHVEQLEIQKLRKSDLEIVEYLKANQPARFKELKKLAKSAARAKH